MKNLATVFVALVILVGATEARAVTFTGSTTATVKKEAAQTLKATATFVVSNLDLVVTLSNTGTADPKSIGEILTGVFFDVAGNPTLAPVSATVGADSKVIGGRTSTDLANVSSEWAYDGDLAKAPGGDVYGISSTKLSLFKKGSLFPGEKIKGTSPLSGIQFGITTLQDMVSNNEGGLKNKSLIQSTVVFVFAIDNMPANFSTSDISDVTFQYGASIKKGFDIAGEMVAQIPEPSSLALVAMGLAGALTLTRSRARRL